MLNYVFFPFRSSGGIIHKHSMLSGRLTKRNLVVYCVCPYLGACVNLVNICFVRNLVYCDVLFTYTFILRYLATLNYESSLFKPSILLSLLKHHSTSLEAWHKEVATSQAFECTKMYWVRV